MLILAGIVTYNPDIERLRENLDAIVKQVDGILVVDNGSDNIADAERLVRRYPKAAMLKNGENLGIARALNQEMEYAEENGYGWVLALDQDSVCPEGMTDEYRKYVSIDEQIGMFACRFKNRGIDGSVKIPVTSQGTKEVKIAITSGCMTRVTAWKNSGKYDERLFIDYVDHDFCYSLRKNGYKIIQVSGVVLIHELGQSVRAEKTWDGEKRLVYNYPPSQILL